MSEPHDPDQPDQPDVGSVGEEAAKLLGALSDWAREGDPGAGLGAAFSGLSGLTDLAGQAASRLGDVNDHLATGAAECTYCPVCRTVHALRESSPEIKAHLASAASSLLHAVAGVLATLPPPGSSGSAGASGPTSTGSGTGFERIDLDGDDDD